MSGIALAADIAQLKGAKTSNESDDRRRMVPETESSSELSMANRGSDRGRPAKCGGRAVLSGHRVRRPTDGSEETAFPVCPSVGS
jgi:hypothetical protein